MVCYADDLHEMSMRYFLKKKKKKAKIKKIKACCGQASRRHGFVSKGL